MVYAFSHYRQDILAILFFFLLVVQHDCIDIPGTEIVGGYGGLVILCFSIP